MNLDRVNTTSAEEAREALLRCCGSQTWVEGMVGRRPFANDGQLFAAAEDIWWGLQPADWHEAFAAHSRIGDLNALRAKFGTGEWPAKEQASVAGASNGVLLALTNANRQYEEKFGYIFIVCATGKSAEEMLALLRARLASDPDAELRIAAGEQAKITRLRLEKLLT